MKQSDKTYHEEEWSLPPGWLEKTFELTDRREHLSHHTPYCPRCGDEQIQLIGYSNVPAEWKCRRCKTKFLYEPLIKQET
jgi:transposase-like protein